MSKERRRITNGAGKTITVMIDPEGTNQHIHSEVEWTLTESQWKRIVRESDDTCWRTERGAVVLFTCLPRAAGCRLPSVTVRHTGEGAPVRVRQQDIADGRGPARIAAEILARRMYGRRGVVAALRLDSESADGRTATWEAFVGVPPTEIERRRYGANGINGRNVWLYT